MIKHILIRVFFQHFQGKLTLDFYNKRHIFMMLWRHQLYLKHQLINGIHYITLYYYNESTRRSLNVKNHNVRVST